MNGYDLSRSFFDFCFENPEKINPNHSAIFFFAIEHCNRLGWKEKFGFPTQMAMDAIGIKKHQTYIKYFNDLCDWGFFKLIQKSRNQYSSNIISMGFGHTINGKALGNATVKYLVKSDEQEYDLPKQEVEVPNVCFAENGQSNGQSTGQSNGKSNSPINKPITNNKEPSIFAFSAFWDLYEKKRDKLDCMREWNKLPETDKEIILQVLPEYVRKNSNVKFRKDPIRFLKHKLWVDEEYSSENLNTQNKQKEPSQW